MIVFAPHGRVSRGVGGQGSSSRRDISIVWDMNKVSADHIENRLSRLLLLALGGTYLNVVVYGFSYGAGDHEFELPLINWLRDSSLYPQDPIRDAFARFPTVYWPTIAYISHWMSTQRAIFLLFLLTKLLFFTAIARMVEDRVKDSRLGTCVVFAVALSPFLNDQTPLGASTILHAVQTHATLAVALLLWVGCFLLEQQWIPATILGALAVYLDALYFVFMLFAFAALAMFDWRRRRTEILIAGLLGATISLPWLFLFRGVNYKQFPYGYVEALLAFYPFLLNLHGQERYELLSGASVVLAAALMCVIAWKYAQYRDARFEVLTASFILPVFLGAVFGEFHLTSTIARLQLLRADAFLLLYSILLLQIYGANLLRSSPKGPATGFLLGATAILMPLSDSVGLLWLIFIGMALWADPEEHFERLIRGLVSLPGIRTIGSGLLLAGMVAAWLKHEEWSSTVVVALAILMACFFVADDRNTRPRSRPAEVAVILSAVAILLFVTSRVQAIPRLWNPVNRPTAEESNWRAVQDWARANTPQDAMFLVPTYPGGFRAFSERSSWGEWRDGQAMYLYPPFESEFRRRMMAVGYSWGKWNGTETITATYKHLTWERLSAIAHQNHLSYIIQFRDVVYPATPVFANQDYSVYKVAY
jgi:hypothetical protein